MEKEEDEGQGCEGKGRVLAICPVVKAPSGWGEREKAAPWLAPHMNMSTYVAHMHTHMRAYMGAIVANKHR